jgi:hypothetical protein
MLLSGKATEQDSGRKRGWNVYSGLAENILAQNICVPLLLVQKVERISKLCLQNVESHKV